MLVSIHHIPKETGFMSIKSFAPVDPHSHFKALGSDSNNFYTMWSSGRRLNAKKYHDKFGYNFNYALRS